MENRMLRCFIALAATAVSAAARPASAHSLSALDEPTKTLTVARPFSRELVVMSCDTLDVSARAALPFDAAALAVDGERGLVYVAGPESVRVCALADLKATGELPLKGAVFLAALPGGELAALDKENVLTVARTGPYAVRRAARLDPGADVRGWNSRLDENCRYVPRVMRFDAANNRLHVALGPPDGEIMYARNHKPVDAWLVVNPATGETEALVPVLSPCADIAFDAAAGRAYGVSRAFNADHILVLDIAGQRVGGVIPIEPMEVHGVDRIALAPGGLLALASSWHPKELFFVRRDAPAEWWGDVSPQDPGFYSRSASEIEFALRVGDLGSESLAGSIRPKVVAHTVALWGLRGSHDALHFAPWDEALYLPGERGVVVIGRETVENLIPTSRPTQAFYLREGETLKDIMPRLPTVGREWQEEVGWTRTSAVALRQDHNTLGPAEPLGLAELQSEGDAFRVERYVSGGPLGIFPMVIGPYQVRRDRPRVFITPETLPAIRAKCEGPLREQFEEYKRTMSRGDVHGRISFGMAAGAAFCYLMTGQDEFLAHVRRMFDWFLEDPNRWGVIGGQDSDILTPVAAAYDWSHAGLTGEERERYGRFICGKLNGPDPKTFGLWHSGGNWHGVLTHNGHIGHPMREVAGVALYGEPWLDDAEADAMVKRGVHGLLGIYSAHMETAWDGGNPEAGYCYSIRNLAIPMALAAMWQSATGQNLLERAGFLDHSDAWILYGVRPSLRFTKMADGASGAGSYYFGKNGSYYNSSTLSYEILAGMKQSPYFHWVSKAIGPGPGQGYLYFIYFNPDVTPTPTHADPQIEPQLAAGERTPLARMFRGVGYLFSKSGWGTDALHLYFCGRAFRPELHDTMDSNAFQLFKGGPLLIDSGARWGPTTGYAFNYLRSTLSKNSVLILDPAERLGANFHELSGSSFNTGGQINFVPYTHQADYKTVRLCDRGGFAAYENHPAFMYASSDATAAYAYRKLRYFNRQVVHLRPDTVVIFDRVVSKNPAFKKTFLLHSIHEPETRGNEFGVYADRGLLRGVTLLPESPSLTKIGGPGMEFWVGKEALYLEYPDRDDGLAPMGRNPNFAPVDIAGYGCHKPLPESWTIEDLGEGEMKKLMRRWGLKTREEFMNRFIFEFEAGAWRIEVSPSQPRAQDFFLHVLHATIPPEAPAKAAEAFSPENAVLFPNSELLREDDLIGARISLPDGRLAEVMFETTGRPGGLLRIADAGGGVELEHKLTEAVDRTPRR